MKTVRIVLRAAAKTIKWLLIAIAVTFLLTFLASTAYVGVLMYQFH